MPETKLTLRSLNFSYNETEDCQTCSEGQCHNILKCNNDGKNYFVHVCTIPGSHKYDIYITNMDDPHAKPENFPGMEDSEAAKYLSDRFGFKCA